MSGIIKIQAPINNNIVESLKSGDKVLISGVMFTARDAAHKKIIEAINSNAQLPFDLRGQILYYTGPTPPAPGKVIGSAGPTSSYRMDKYAVRLIERGIKGMVGKGPRSMEVVNAIIKYEAVYMSAVGGAGALISKTVRKSELIAFPELGPEAVYRIEVEDFPAIVVNDCFGGDLFEEGISKYKKTNG